MTTSIACYGLLGIVSFCNLPEPPKPTVVVCPPLVTWSAADQQAAGAALAALPPGHALRKMGVVTVKQRDVVRACQKMK